MVTCWSYGNGLHYGLSMLNWEKTYGSRCGNVCGDALKLSNVLHYGLSVLNLEKIYDSRCGKACFNALKLK